MRLNTRLFRVELKEAGLSEDVLGLNSDGVIRFKPATPQATQDAVLTLFDAHDPTKPEPPSLVAELVTIAIGTPAEIFDAKARLRAAQA